MVYLHCMGPGEGPVPVQGEKWKVHYNRNVHTGPRPGQVAGLIVYYCASPVPCTSASPGSMQCD